MSTGYYDCQICYPRDDIVTSWSSCLGVRCRVVSSLSVNIMLSRFLGAWCCFLGLTCLSIVFRSTSKLVYGSYHLFTENVCRNNTWIDQLFPGFNFECWCSEVTMWGGGCLVVLIPQGPTLWPNGVVEFSGWVITWWTQFPKWTWVD